MKDARPRKTKYTVLVILLVVLFVAASVTAVVYAEFTKSDRVKKVVAPMSDGGMLFSSNYLATPLILPNVNKRVLYANDVGSSIETTITVCNYAQKNRSKTYEKTITYDLEAKLVKSDGTTAAQLSDLEMFDTDEVVATIKDSSDNTIITLKKTAGYLSGSVAGFSLTHTASTTHLYDMAFSEKLNGENIYVYVKAELNPDDNAYPEITSLDAVFSAKVGSAEVGASWEGYFSDPGALDGTTPAPSTYDGYNYTISGNGAGTVTLKWKAAYLTPNAKFLIDLANVGESGTNGDFTTFAFPVDSETQDLYELQFYKTSDDPSDYPDWETVKGYVEVVFLIDPTD